MVDAAWACAAPEESIEHVHAQVMYDRLYVTIFRVGTNYQNTQAIAARICQSVILSSSFISRYCEGRMEIAEFPLRRSYEIDPPHDS